MNGVEEENNLSKYIHLILHAKRNIIGVICTSHLFLKAFFNYMMVNSNGQWNYIYKLYNSVYSIYSFVHHLYIVYIHLYIFIVYISTIHIEPFLERPEL